MTLNHVLKVRLSNQQLTAIQTMAVYLHTDVSGIIRLAIDDAIETLSRWTGLEITITQEESPRET